MTRRRRSLALLAAMLYGGWGCRATAPPRADRKQHQRRHSMVVDPKGAHVRFISRHGLVDHWIADGLRVNVLPRAIIAAGKAFPWRIADAQQLEGGWVFALEDGSVYAAATFLAEPSLLLPGPCERADEGMYLQPSEGRVSLRGIDGRWRWSDGRSIHVVPIEGATSVAWHGALGAAVVRHQTLRTTVDGGATWREVPLTVAPIFSMGVRAGLFLLTSGGWYRVRDDGSARRHDGPTPYAAAGPREPPPEPITLPDLAVAPRPTVRAATCPRPDPRPRRLWSSRLWHPRFALAELNASGGLALPPAVPWRPADAVHMTRTGTLYANRRPDDRFGDPTFALSWSESPGVEPRGSAPPAIHTLAGARHLSGPPLGVTRQGVLLRVGDRIGEWLPNEGSLALIDLPGWWQSVVRLPDGRLICLADQHGYPRTYGVFASRPPEALWNLVLLSPDGVLLQRRSLAEHRDVLGIGVLDGQGGVVVRDAPSRDTLTWISLDGVERPFARVDTTAPFRACGAPTPGTVTLYPSVLPFGRWSESPHDAAVLRPQGEEFELDPAAGPSRLCLRRMLTSIPVLGGRAGGRGGDAKQPRPIWIEAHDGRFEATLDTGAARVPVALRVLEGPPDDAEP